MSAGPRRRASPLEYAYAAALAALAVAGLLAPDRPPQTPRWQGPFPVHRLGEDAGRPPPVRVHETLDIEVLAPAPRGDPFDAVAAATFTHAGTGAAYRVQAFYVGGEAGSAVFRFRFTPPLPGEWRFATASALPGLDGHAGTVTAMPAELPGPLLGDGGRFLLTAPDGTLAPTTYNVYSGARGLVEDLGSLPRDEAELVAALEPLVAEAAALGFDALHVAVYHEWLSLGARRSDRHGSAQPDPRTFRVLETLAALAHRHDLFLHLWMWGDEARRLSSRGVPADPTVPGDPGGAAGAAYDRLLRYLAARLGPLPNWTLSYGFDLDEWASVAEARAWAARLGELLPVPHLLTATEEGRGRTAFDLGAEKLPLVSRDLELAELAVDPYAVAVAELERASGRPLLLESDLRLQPSAPWDMEGVRRALWRFALAGGVGVVVEVGEAGLPAPEQAATFARFWEGRLPAHAATSRAPGGALALVAADGRSGVVYVEDAAAVPLAAVPAGASVVAVDARAPYAELPVSPDGGAWEAPHASDWALAFAAP